MSVYGPHRRRHRHHAKADAAIDVAAAIALTVLAAIIVTGRMNVAVAATCVAVATLPIVTGEPAAVLRSWLTPGRHQAPTDDDDQDHP